MVMFLLWLLALLCPSTIRADFQIARISNATLSIKSDQFLYSVPYASVESHRACLCQWFEKFNSSISILWSPDRLVCQFFPPNVSLILSENPSKIVYLKNFSQILPNTESSTALPTTDMLTASQSESCSLDRFRFKNFSLFFF